MVPAEWGKQPPAKRPVGKTLWAQGAGPGSTAWRARPLAGCLGWGLIGVNASSEEERSYCLAHRAAQNQQVLWACGEPLPGPQQGRLSTPPSSPDPLRGAPVQQAQAART